MLCPLNTFPIFAYVRIKEPIPLVIGPSIFVKAVKLTMLIPISIAVFLIAGLKSVKYFAKLPIVSATFCTLGCNTSAKLMANASTLLSKSLNDPSSVFFIISACALDEPVAESIELRISSYASFVVFNTASNADVDSVPAMSPANLNFSASVSPCILVRN